MPDAPFLPILDRVLIRRIEAEATAEGFSVPEKYRQHSNLGIVIEVGENVARLTDRVKVGAKVLYGEYTAEQWDAPNGDVYWSVRVQDIRGVICE
jgi:co-chaperonin GroES (HSP10)